MRQDPTYVVHSPLWERWFEAENEEWRPSIEAHLEALDDEDVDYESQEEAHAQQLAPMALATPRWL
jgi:hypothetical protein